MHDLTPLTALGGHKPRQEIIGQITLSENPDLALASVASRLGQEVACREHLKAILGKAPEAGKFTAVETFGAFWISPEAWMITAPFETHENLATELTKHFKETASITEQSDAWCCFDLCGPNLEDVIERLSPANIRAMKKNEACRTSIDHLGCFLLRPAPSDWLRILGPRSSAGSLFHALVAAIKSAV